MPSLRAIKKRIRAVENTKQITKAMEMVAAAKLRKAQARIESYRPYARKMQEMLGNLSAAAGGVEHPFFAAREVRKVAFVVFTSDRGLCGSFNSNLIRRTNHWITEHADREVGLVLLGKKGLDYFRRRPVRILKSYLDFGGNVELNRVREITRDLTGLFLSGEVDQIMFLYTAFISTASYRITQTQFLPIKAEFAADRMQVRREYIFEPDAARIFQQLLPSYAQVVVQMALAESVASEHGTRMIAMGAATQNAEEMVDHLTLVRNKARQAAITKELLEIVSGAEALK